MLSWRDPVCATRRVSDVSGSPCSGVSSDGRCGDCNGRIVKVVYTYCVDNTYTLHS